MLFFVDQMTNVGSLGGAVIFTKEQFVDVNGFSNLYWGENSAENDDLYLRLWKKSKSIVKATLILQNYYISCTLIHLRQIYRSNGN